jgi:uncharacterized protein VirK/YbjX
MTDAQPDYEGAWRELHSLMIGRHAFQLPTNVVVKEMYEIGKAHGVRYSNSQ